MPGVKKKRSKRSASTKYFNNGGTAVLVPPYKTIGRLWKSIKNRGVRFIKVLLGGYGAAVGVVGIMVLFDVVFLGDKYDKTISENFDSIIIILTIVMSLTLMRWLK
jgi:hypothetical protein